MTHKFCGPWILHKPPKLWTSLRAKEVVYCRSRLSHVEGVCLMSGIVVLTSKGWRVCPALECGWVLSWVRCGNLDEMKRMNSTSFQGLENHKTLESFWQKEEKEEVQTLIHGFLWWWASSRLIFYLKWHLHSSFSFSIPLQSDLKKQRNPLIKKIQGLQALHGATLCGIRASSSRWCSFIFSIFLFGQFTLIPCYSSYSPYISSIVLWFGVV